ncbi:MAG: Hsp20/alpha crystallin family protein [Candidatus Omnitrophota bacterium]
MALIKWNQKNYDPFRELSDLENRAFELTLFPGLDKNLSPFRGFPAVDVDEDKDNVIVKADLPGLKENEIELNIDDDILTVRGERKIETEKKERSYHRVERSYGVFERSLQLGVGIDKDKVKASYKNGVLEIVLPKIEKEKPKQIKIDIN